MTGSAKNRSLNSALGMATRLLPALGSCYSMYFNVCSWCTANVYNIGLVVEAGSLYDDSMYIQ